MNIRELAAMLINPYNHQSLHPVGEQHLEDVSGNRIPVVNGIPDFLALEKIGGMNKKHQRLYDNLSPFNDIAERVVSLFVDMEKLRREWLADVEVKPGFKILETSVGSGWNIKALPGFGDYYGLDISGGMLRQAARNMTKWNRTAQLFRGNAEYLPFKDHTFDCVFHAGGLHFFDNRVRAIREMVRVARRGSRIVIIDETTPHIRKQYRSIPSLKGYLNNSSSEALRALAPLELVPGNMREQEVKLLDHGRMYQLSFRTA
ncbi:methyltransferase domain-containing protein [Chitinophaga oryzae]|uniref:Methyltransferase domain-containing protein n=1 Tax=Chitinophaga oryzae TaxID=2725414 RepID=A0ABX6LB11_9BACT|nr:methyltransferase domain-containing protein [Chitinophaga oryzae]QJB37291.1 methyltransferase domain-containing protein [Chitinophaga oryzae]